MRLQAGLEQLKFLRLAAVLAHLSDRVYHVVAKEDYIGKTIDIELPLTDAAGATRFVAATLLNLTCVGSR